MLLKYQKEISNNKYGFQWEKRCVLSLYYPLPKPNLIMLMPCHAMPCPLPNAPSMYLQLKKVIVHNRVSKQCLFVSTIQIGHGLLCPVSTFFNATLQGGRNGYATVILGHTNDLNYYLS